MIARLKQLPSWVIAVALVSIPMLVELFLNWHKVPLAAGATIGPQDPDPWLRLVLVRDWMNGGSWYDHTMLRSNAPWGGIASPWTRPLDVVIRLLTELQPASVDLTVRLVRSALILPVIWMTLLLLGINRAIRAVTPLPAAPFMMSALVCTALTMWNYFAIANADHHAPLAVLFIWALGGVLQPAPSARLSIVTGLLLGMLLWVSPEGLVLIGGVYAWYGLLWLAGDTPGARPLPIIATAAAAMTLLATMIERPFSAWFTPIYDSVSVVYVFILAGAAGLAWCLLLLPLNEIRARFLSIVIGSVLLLVAIYLVYPLALHGPMALADPYIFSNFLPRIVEARPLFTKPVYYVIAMLLQPGLALGICLQAIKHDNAMLPAKRAIQLGFFLLLTLALYLSQQRWYYYLYPIVTVVLAPWMAALLTPHHPFARGRWPALLIEHLPESQQMMRRLPALAAILAAPLLFSYLSPSRSTEQSRAIDACYKEARKLIYGGTLNNINGGKPLIFLMPTDLGGEMLFWTPHRIVASNYHREGPGIRYVWEADLPASATAMRHYLAKRDIQALMICPNARPPEKSMQQSLYQGKHVPAWLVKVPVPVTPNVPGPVIYLLPDMVAPHTTPQP